MLAHLLNPSKCGAWSPVEASASVNLVVSREQRRARRTRPGAGCGIFEVKRR